MKRKLLLLFALMAIGLSGAWAYDFSAVAPSGQTLYYDITGGNAVVTYQYYLSSSNYSNLTGALVIPASVTYNGTTYSVTSIGGAAFANCIDLTSVTIPNSVTSIGGSAFEGCSGLTSVTIPNSVTSIEDAAFARCSGLTSIIVESGNTHFDSRNNCNAIIETGTNILICGCMNTIIPNSVTCIGNYAFAGCSGLTSVTIPNSVTCIGIYAFLYCSGLTSVTIGNSVDTIGYGAFCGCSGLTSVTIPNSVTYIGDCAFQYCSGLTSVTIPESVTHLGRLAFCSEYGGNLHVQFNAIKCDGGYIDWDFSAVLNPFDNSLRSISFGDSVSWIPTALCVGCSNLAQVHFSNSIEIIDSFAFSDCTSLTSIVLPNSVDSIGQGVFSGCTNITSLTLGEGLKWVGNNSFDYMTSLSTIICRGTEPAELNNINVFEGTPTNNIEVIVPCNATDTYRAAYGWNTLQNYSEQLFHTLTVRPADNTKGVVTILVQPDCQNLQAQFQASAYNGFHFDHWSDGNTDNPRTLILTQDTVLEAFFLADGEEGISDLASAGITVSTNGRTITLSGTNGQMLAIYDVTGRVIVREQAVEGKAYTMPNTGVYMVKVGSHKAEKVVVIR